jgi:hypothetical protein
LIEFPLRVFWVYVENIVTYKPISNAMPKRMLKGRLYSKKKKKEGRPRMR